MSIESLRKKLDRKPADAGTVKDENVRFGVGNIREVTVLELRQAIEGNADHPKAKDFAKAIEGLPDAAKVGIEYEDIIAVLDNKEVQTEEEEVQLPTGQKVMAIKKSLVDPQSKAPRATGPMGENAPTSVPDVSKSEKEAQKLTKEDFGDVESAVPMEEKPGPTARHPQKFNQPGKER